MSGRLTMTGLLAALLLMVSSVASACGTVCGAGPGCGVAQPMVAMSGTHACCAHDAVMPSVCGHAVDAAQVARTGSVAGLVLQGAPVRLVGFGAEVPAGVAPLRAGQGSPPMLGLPIVLRTNLRV